MKMKATLVTYFLIAQVFLVLADQKTESKATDVKKRENANIGEVDLSTDEKLPEAQRKRDHGYYYSRLSHSIHGRYPGRHRGRIITRPQSQINRPFKQYGPPSQGGSDFNFDHPTTSGSLINQDAPEPVKQNSFVPENPIASQNNQPFGQHTANYLPPRNQKLPVVTPPYQFSTHEFSDNQQFQQQQQQQQQHFPEQNQQLQVDNQNFFGQNFENQNIGQNGFNQNPNQISDAALFLTQNAQAISNLYGAPAPNQDFAPHNQEFEPINQQQQQQNQLSQNLQVSIDNQQSRFPSQLPSYASGVLDNEETLEKIQSLEKDRFIAQLQLALSNRENSARFAQHENLAVTPSQFSSGDASFGHHSTSFLPTTANTFQGYYATSTVPSITTTTQAPVQAPSTSISTPTTTLHPGGNEANSAQLGSNLGSNLPASQGFGSTLVNPSYPQYDGFVPTLVSPSGFIPGTPSFGATFYPTLAKPIETAPTHFAIPIPSLDVSKPAHPPSTTSAVTKPPNDTPSHPSFPSHPSTPTFSITLGPFHPPQASPPVQTPVVKPNPVPVVPAGTPTFSLHPAATPVHPTYGLHPAATPVHPTYGLQPAATPVHPTYGLYPTVVNPGFVYKPVKVHPLYYYPGRIHRKTVATSALTYHPWNYAPSYTSAKIWK